ncbi:hemocyanin 1 [Biomphalaria glabrata]|nr:hemocyanin 1 [Biomphalaria glabrata]
MRLFSWRKISNTELDFKPRLYMGTECVNMEINQQLGGWTIHSTLTRVTFCYTEHKPLDFIAQDTNGYLASVPFSIVFLFLLR